MHAQLVARDGTATRNSASDTTSGMYPQRRMDVIRNRPCCGFVPCTRRPSYKPCLFGYVFRNHGSHRRRVEPPAGISLNHSCKRGTVVHQWSRTVSPDQSNIGTRVKVRPAATTVNALSRGRTPRVSCLNTSKSIAIANACTRASAISLPRRFGNSMWLNCASDKSGREQAEWSSNLDKNIVKTGNLELHPIANYAMDVGSG